MTASRYSTTKGSRPCWQERVEQLRGRTWIANRDESGPFLCPAHIDALLRRACTRAAWQEKGT